MCERTYSRCQNCWTRIPVGDRFCTKCGEIHKQSEDCESTEDKLYRFQDLYFEAKQLLDASVKAQESLQRRYAKLKEDCGRADVFMTQDEFENALNAERVSVLESYFDAVMRGDFRLSNKAVLEMEKIKKGFLGGKK